MKGEWVRVVLEEGWHLMCLARCNKDWPPSSHDLSPIENLWGRVKGKVDKRGCKTFDELQLTVMCVIKNVPKPILRAYSNSMKARLAQAIHPEGAKTSY